jgi:hypothetical protein
LLKGLDPLDITENDTDIYSDDENPKEKKIANKTVDYTLGKKKLIGERLKVKNSRIKHRVIIPGDSKRNREDLSSSTLPKETSHGDSSNDSNDNKNTSINNILSLKTIITSFIFMRFTRSLWKQNYSGD